ncbi:hypothetical protein [Pseudarthrobacter sp. N5]|uniref:hypothetical protein n=1 Tax=Pseudarthrobacter sp. N5 TaxID=3418416 RepID=UPI003CFA4D31
MDSEDTSGSGNTTSPANIPPAAIPPEVAPAATPVAPAATPEASPERRGITVRSAPRFVPFLILGGLVGIAVAGVVAYALPGDASYDRNSVFGFFLVMFGAGGVILGAITALVLDRLSVRRARHAVVESVPYTKDDA